jgi:hypothetical protein
MEGFETSQYRENLAKETGEYQVARSETIAVRRQKIEEQQVIEKQRERLREGETKEKILDGVEAFTNEVLEKYPQTSEDGKLNYYLSGSLGVMMLLKGERFEVIDEARLPEIVSVAEKEVPPEAAKALEGFVRKIGDLDFVPLEEWKKSDKRMRKGGGGPKIGELSETAKKVLKISEGQKAVMCDPLETVTPHRVARMKINGKEIYITEPKMMLAYKTVHLGQTFENARKTDKFVSDFNTMLKGMEAIYSREELLRVTHETMFAYAPNSPNNTFVPYHNPKFRGELRKFYDEVLSIDPDFDYLKQLQYGKERSVGILKVLHRLQSPEAKQTMIDFINQHREQIDKWHVNSTSPHNREIIADFLLSHPDLLKDFQTHTQAEATRDSIIETLKVYVWAFDKYSNQMPNSSKLEMRPTSSTTMDILTKVNEENIRYELRDIGELLEFGMDEFHLDQILGSKFTSNPETKRKLLDGLKSARARLEDEEFRKFSYELYQAVSSSSYYDSASNRFIDIKEGELQERVARVFEQFGVE